MRLFPAASASARRADPPIAVQITVRRLVLTCAHCSLCPLLHGALLPLRSINSTLTSHTFTQPWSTGAVTLLFALSGFAGGPVVYRAPATQAWGAQGLHGVFLSAAAQGALSSPSSGLPGFAPMYGSAGEGWQVASSALPSSGNMTILAFVATGAADPYWTIYVNGLAQQNVQTARMTAADPVNGLQIGGYYKSYPFKGARGAGTSAKQPA